MQALITGGTGFIGSNLALKMLSDGHDVTITGTDNEYKFTDERLKILPPDFANINWAKLGSVDVVFHQAAINDTTIMDRNEMFRVNVEASEKLFNDAIIHGCRKIVYASSTAIYGDLPAPHKEEGPFKPLNPYAESKLALDEFATEFAKQHPDVVVVGLRYCNVYGPGETKKGKRATMIYQLAQQMKTGNPKLFKYGEQKRDYIYIKDLVQANILAAGAQESCIVNCGFGEAVEFNELVNILNDNLGASRTPEYIDNPYIDKYQAHTECDMSLAKEKIGFIPKFDIKKGIADYRNSGFLV
ncbi:MAG: NAD-dependent epimerase/dehydratase family protein [bacterium]|nr:NAD-dependent epimerase/dehydratase family protein [bacterium]